ncbi:MAG: PadR family transcriptional regulator [Solirubrobacteraceae bacterium]
MAEAARETTSIWNGVRSPISWALLGMVIEEPGHGYALLKRFKVEYAEHLPIKSDWHVYRALKHMTEKGLLERRWEDAGAASELTAEDERRIHYRATSDGVHRYSEGLLREIAASHRQSGVFARQLAALAGEPKMALGIIDRYEEECIAEDRRLASPAIYGSGIAARLARQAGRDWLAGTLQWLDYARGQFLALGSGGTDADEPA